MNKIAAALIIICFVSCTTFVSSNAIANYLTMHSTGTVIALGLEVYNDAACTSRCTSIDWGIMTPDMSTSKIIYVNNTGNSLITLNLTTSTWNPSNAAAYMNLTWDYNGTQLAVGELRMINLTLTVSPDIQGVKAFSFDIIISFSY